jgi:hypothetical protein
MRTPLPAALLLLLLLSAFALTTAGCDLVAKLKGHGDAGALDAEALDAAPVVDAPDGATGPVEGPTDAGAAPTPTVTTAATTTAHPVVVVDAGAKTDAGHDAGAVIVDAGLKADAAGPAPAPTPTLRLPRFRLDGGSLPKLGL